MAPSTIKHYICQYCLAYITRFVLNPEHRMVTELARAASAQFKLSQAINFSPKALYALYTLQ
eukprot:6204298-Pleurochrysis_carterae.AAC.5